MISFFGFLLSISSLDIYSYLIPIGVFLITTGCILSFTFALNNYYDIDSDRNNPKKIHSNALAQGKISKKSGLFFNILFLLIPLIITVVYDHVLFLLCIVLIGWMWIYSSPPLRLKGRPGFDILWHFFAFVLLIIWGSLLGGSLGLINWLTAVSIGVCCCIGQFLNHLHDYEFDKESGVVTFTVWKGVETTRKALKINIIVHVLCFLPLLVLYSFSYVVTIIVLFLGILLGVLFVLKINNPSVSKIYYFPIFVSFFVYMNCFLYRLFDLLNVPLLYLW